MMALFVTGLVLLLLMVLNVAGRVTGLSFLTDALSGLSQILDVNSDALLPLISLLGTAMMVTGYVQLQRKRDR